MKLAAAVLASLALVAASAPNANAVIFGFKSFKTSIDVDLHMTQHTTWNGVRAGCFAPFEKWDYRYSLDIDSTPTRKSKPTNAQATVQSTIPEGSGTSYSYGAPNSFKQSASDASWELTTTNPASCGETPPVPDWATSPTCKKISERVGAILIESSADGTDDGDGILQLIRTRTTKPKPFGKSIGASCYRTLHPLETAFADAEVAITTTSTLLSIPVPGLKEKLRDIGSGSAKSRPSFRIKIRYTSSCNFYGISPRTAEKPDWIKSPFSQPHKFLGSFNGEAERSKCTLVGSGSATVRRESKAIRL